MELKWSATLKIGSCVISGLSKLKFSVELIPPCRYIIAFVGLLAL